MHVPDVMEKVHLAGVDEVYLVLSVDHQAESVDVLPILFGGVRLKTVPFFCVEAIAGDAAEELRRRRRRR
jgi:hypothetical protein